MFLIHKDHEYMSRWKHDGRWEAAFNNLNAFLRRIQATYGYNYAVDPDLCSRENSCPPVQGWLPAAAATKNSWTWNDSFRSIEAAEKSISAHELDFVHVHLSQEQKDAASIEFLGGAGSTLLLAGAGRSCATSCSMQDMSCFDDDMGVLNNCRDIAANEALRRHCSGGCEENTGRDQPAAIVGGNWKGKCLVNRWKPGCSGSHSSSRRMCNCRKM